MSSPGTGPASALEGRDAELGALSHAWDAACAGHGRVAVVTGEAGIGKSTLIASLAELASAAGAAVVLGRAWEFADAPPYFPLVPGLSALGIDVGQARMQAPFALWESVLSALSSAATARPQLWLLEDLHAADLQTLDLLSFLAQPLRVLRVLVVVTARARDPRLDQRGEQRLIRLARDGLDLRLGALSREQVARLARRYAGELSQATLGELFELTSGNPLFVVECARAIKAGGFPAQLGASPTIRQVVLERLQLLPEATARLLESAAVLGREFSAAGLARLHDLLPARVIDLLLSALRSGVVLERAPGSYAFSHVVVHGAVYDQLSAERRSSLHAQAERALAGMPESPELSLERARHALCSITRESEEYALSLVLRAGAALEASGAFDRAHALYTRLRHKLATGEMSQRLSGQQLLHFAKVAEAAGNSAESRALSLAVQKAARARGDHEELALAALELGRPLRPGLIDDELVAGLREAASFFPDQASALGCRVLARLAAALQPAADPNQPIALASEAIARAQKIGDPALILETLDVAGSAYVDFAPLELRLTSAEELLTRATAARDVARIQRARARLSFDRATLGNFDAYELLVTEMLHTADAIGQPRAKIRPLLMASLLAANRGKLADSAALIAEAEQLLCLTDDAGLLLSLRAHRLSLAIMLHDDAALQALEPNLARLVVGVPDADLVLASLRGVVRARLERAEPAREDVRFAWQRGAADSGSFLALLAEAAAFVQEREVCAACHAQLLPSVGHENLGGHVSVSYEGPVSRLLGLLESALDHSASAESRLREALALSERRGFAVWVAQGRYDLAQILSRVGREAEARTWLEGAATLAESLPMPGLVARARAKLTGAPASPAVVPTSPVPTESLCMRREGELYLISLGAWTARIRATRGAELLARLTEAPNQEIHVLALASDEASMLTESNAGESLDRTALRQYRARLRDLEQLQNEAESNADLGLREALERERTALERELSRALGLGGRARQAGSATERARVNVQRRLKDALERVSESCPELGAWLGRCVRTGTYCSFRLTP